MHEATPCHLPPRPDRTSAVTLMPRAMVGATAAMATVGVALAVVAGPLWAVSTRAAQDLLQQTPYVEAVLPDGVPPALAVSGSERSGG